MSLDPRLSYRLLAEPEDRAVGHRLLEVAGTGTQVEQNEDGLILAGAFEDDRLVGAVASRFAPDDAISSRAEGDALRVAALAVKSSAGGQGIGGGLMRLQRLLAMRRAAALVTWSQDPLDGRLSHLAIHKLGAVCRSYRPTPAGLLDMEWWVSTPRVKSRLAGGRPELDLAHALEAGAPKLNAGSLDDGGLLRPTGGEAGPSSATALVEVPHAIGELQAREPDLLLEWRAHLRRILEQAFAQGYWLTDYLWLKGERAPRAYLLLIDGERTLS